MFSSYFLFEIIYFRLLVVGVTFATLCAYSTVIVICFKIKHNNEFVVPFFMWHVLSKCYNFVKFRNSRSTFLVCVVFFVLFVFFTVLISSITHIIISIHVCLLIRKVSSSSSGSAK